MPSRFQCYSDDHGWRWRLLGANHRGIAHGPDAFPDRTAAMRDAVAVAALAALGRIDVVGDGREWHWILLDHGRVRATSVTRFRRRLDCARAIQRFRGSAVTAPVTDETPARPGTAAPRR